MRQSYTKLFYLSFSVDPLTTELTVPANRFSDLAKYKARTSARAPSLAATALEIWLSACVKYWSDRGLVLSVSLDFIVFFLSTHYGFFYCFWCRVIQKGGGWREGGRANAQNLQWLYGEKLNVMSINNSRKIQVLKYLYELKLKILGKIIYWSRLSETALLENYNLGLSKHFSLKA